MLRFSVFVLVRKKNRKKSAILRRNFYNQAKSPLSLRGNCECDANFNSVSILDRSNTQCKTSKLPLQDISVDILDI